MPAPPGALAHALARFDGVRTFEPDPRYQLLNLGAARRCILQARRQRLKPPLLSL
jgi:hypothetical protein